MLLDEGRAVALRVEKPDELSGIGRILVAKVKDLVPGIGAAFLETSKGEVAYYSLKENYTPLLCNRPYDGKLKCGDLILVQVEHDAIKQKAPTVTCNLNLTGRYCVIDRSATGKISLSRKIDEPKIREKLMSEAAPYKNEAYGLIIRTEAAAASDEEFLSELNYMTKEYLDLLENAKHRTAFSVLKQSPGTARLLISQYHLNSDDLVVSDLEPIFNNLKEGEVPVQLYRDSYPLEKAYGLEKELKEALHRIVWLKSGANLVIEHTEALHTIDVNTGKADLKKSGNEAAYLKINKEACEELVRQLMLRNLSGMILVDFINMKSPAARQELIEHLKTCLQNDPGITKYVDMTGLGLIELTRKRSAGALYESITLKELGEEHE